MGRTIDVDVWVWRLTGTATEIARFESLLSREERTRAERLTNPERRAQFIAGRGRMREILSRYLHDLEPAHVAIVAGADGKPHLDGLIAPPHFNLSHTDAIAALAITADHPVGIDIETVRPGAHPIARRFLTPAEADAISARPEAERAMAFTRCWVCKEAFVKATGEGLRRPFNAFTVAVDPLRPAVRAIDGTPAADVARWKLLYVMPTANHTDDTDPASTIVGAIALQTGAADDRVAVHRRS